MIDKKTHKYIQEAVLKRTKVSERTPEQNVQAAENLSRARQWHEDHPVDFRNIVSHYDEATEGEHHDGRNWYSDAQHFSKAIAKSTGVPHHTVVGLTANYSPQTDWHTNMLHAARVARHRKAVGGKEQKPYFKYGKTLASNQQKDAADKMIKGTHYNDVLKGNKVRAFAHLIEHGGNADNDKPEVCVDRHAHSVASGARITDEAFGISGLKSKKKYDQVKSAYIQAAKHINERSGAKIGDSHYTHPHQVQAITWLVRQRKNNEEDLKNSPKEASLKLVKAAKARESAKTKWQNYSGTWHPELKDKFRE